MVNTKLKLLYILLTLFVFKPLLAEGMMVFTDYMAMAQTEKKLETLLLKDK